MARLEINNTTRHKINGTKLQALTEEFLRAYRKKNARASLAIVSAARMQRLNRDYRGIDKPTDVLSFPYSSPLKNEPQYLGEVVINIDEIAKLSRYQAMFEELGLKNLKNKSAAKNYLFYFLFIHGLLHLIGYQDERPSARRDMLRRGRDFLEKAL